MRVAPLHRGDFADGMSNQNLEWIYGETANSIATAFHLSMAEDDEIEFVMRTIRTGAGRRVY